jgi:tellurite resistance protein TerC
MTELLDLIWLNKPLWMWGVFFTTIITLLILDLGVFHRHEHEISIKESLWMSAFYISLGLCYGGFVWYAVGPQGAKEYWTGFLLEKSLALDNIFVIVLIFSYFGVPKLYQHRVLFWGILGAIFFRGVMIALGATLIARFEWILLLFAAFLVITGIKMLIMDDKKHDLKNSKVLKVIKSLIPVTDAFHGKKFFIKEQGRRTATPLFLALILVEFADVVFAVDSIPAIFAITLDPFIVLTSNIFAILGLRALYFALATIIHRFHYLKYSLSLILVFIGGKVLVAHFMSIEKVPAMLSLGVTITLIAGGIGYSLIVSSIKRKNGTSSGH